MWFSFIIISIVGTLFHFLYDWSGHNKMIGLFAAVNESTWEHIKIALTPSLLWGLIDGFLYGANPNYFLAKSMSLLTMIVVIPVLFYLYSYILKKHVLIIDILIFYVAIFLGQSLFYYVLNGPAVPYIFRYSGAVLLFIIFGFYMTATLLPLKNFLFKDPITKKYGLKGHK